MYKSKVKTLRERLGFTQLDIATHLNIDRGHYGHYETEYVIMPTKHLNTLANFYNVSIDYLFDFNDATTYNDSKIDIDKDLSGKRLKDLRKTHKITQEKLAKKLNTSRTTITEYERGTNIIATPFLYSICKTYKISADYLLGRIDEPKYFDK